MNAPIRLDVSREIRPGIPRLNALTDILLAVSVVYGLMPIDITGRLRTKAIAEARMMTCLIARRCTRLSLTEIGFMVERDHTTVLALIKSAERLHARDPWFAAAASGLIERFGGNQ